MYKLYIYYILCIYFIKDIIIMYICKLCIYNNYVYNIIIIYLCIKKYNFIFFTINIEILNSLIIIN